MKQLATLLVGLMPVVASAQFLQDPDIIDLDRFSVGLDVGAVFDRDFSYYDEDTWSPDMSSDQNDSFKYSKRLSLNYNVSENFIMGFSYAQGDIYGDNEVAFYNGSFEQFNAHTRVNIAQLNPEFSVYAKLGIGIVTYESDRTFLEEENVYLSSKGEALNTNQALGVSYKYDDNWSFVAEARLDRVGTDDFDSWDDGSGTDKFLQISVGARYRHIPLKDRSCKKPLEMPAPVVQVPDSILTAQDEKIKEMEKQIETLNNTLGLLEETLKQQEDRDYDEALAVAMEIRKRLFFGPGSAKLPVTYQPSLNDLAEILNKYPHWKVTVLGYADSDADEEFNQALSEKRAQSVKDMLIMFGVERERVAIQGMGENSPFESNETEDGKTLNRRVEINLSK